MWLALAAASGATLVALLLAGYRWRISRDDPAEGPAPANLTPGMVGIATRGRVLPRDILAILVDLAARGHLVIQVVGEGRGRDWLLRADLAGPHGLSPVEQSFLARLFARGQKVSLKELAAERRGVLRKLATKLLAAADKDGWFHPVKASRRIEWWPFLIAVTVAVVVVVAGIGWVPAVLFLLAGIITMYQPQLRARRTARGSAAQAHLLAHREALRNGSRLRTAEDLRRELPWLVAFGLTSRPAELARGLGIPEASLQFDWIEGPGGALDVSGIAVEVLGETVLHLSGRALGGAVAGAAAALLDGI